MRILLTGANGFLGRSVAQTLQAAGSHEVLRLVRRSTGAPQEIVADFTQPGLARHLPSQVDVIVHAGAYVPAKEAAAELALAMATNAEGTLRLLEYAARAGARRFVYVSSAAVYGSVLSTGAIAETVEPQPDNPYALSKLAGELMLESFRFVHGVETVGLRFSYIYGAGMRETSVVRKFAGLARSHMPLSLFNSGQDYFDLVHIGDAVRAVESALRQGTGIFNIGSGKPTSVLELATTLIAVTGSASRVEKLPATGKYHSKYLDIAKAGTDLDWVPRVPLAQGLADL